MADETERNYKVYYKVAIKRKGKIVVELRRAKFETKKDARYFRDKLLSFIRKQKRRGKGLIISLDEKLFWNGFDEKILAVWTVETIKIEDPK